MQLNNPCIFAMLDNSTHPLDSRNYAEHLFDMAAVIMLVLDANGRVERINPKGCEILGHQVEDILGKDWFDHFLPDNLPARDATRLPSIGERGRGTHTPLQQLRTDRIG